MQRQNKLLSCNPIRILIAVMKKILTERNLAAVLFVLVMVAFSLAHEDSKKRNNYYQAGFSATDPGTSASLDIKKETASVQP